MCCSIKRKAVSMNDQMLAGIAEATRLTREGRLSEATTLIQRTLHGTYAQETASTSAGHRVDQPIDVTYQVIDAIPDSLEPSLHQPDQTNSATVHDTFVPSDRTIASGTSKPGAVEVIDIPFVSSANRPAATPQVPPFMPGSNHFPQQNQGQEANHAAGQFVTGSYTNHAGSRTYKLYIPSGYHGQPLPLIVMLHGCTQTPDDFAVGTRMNVLAERDNFFVVYPAQSSSANHSRCWNWFQTSDQRRDQGEPSLIAGITRSICSNYHVDTRRVCIAGLSAGGAMAAILGATYPDLFAAIGVHSGLPYGAAHDLPSAFSAMRDGKVTSLGQRNVPHRDTHSGRRAVPTIVFHGDQDTTVHPSNGDRVRIQQATPIANGSEHAAKTKLHVSVQQGQMPAGRAYTRSIYHDANGQSVVEQWLIHGGGHAWSGGSSAGSFTDPKGPDATQEMIRFFAEHILEA